MFRVWLDDERPMPTGFNTHVKTAQEAINFLKTGNVETISLDHDLGEVETGYTVAKYIEQAAFHGEIGPVQIFIHTANPAGRKNICVAVQNAYRFWNSRQ